MTAHRGRQLMRGFAAWAQKHDLTPHPHDAAFRGTLGGTLVDVETGIRDSGLYVVVVTVHRACGLMPTVLRSGDRTDDDPPIVSRLRAVLDEHLDVLSIAVEAATITVRLRAGSRVELVADVLDAVIEAVEHPTTAGPYR